MASGAEGDDAEEAEETVPLWAVAGALAVFVNLSFLAVILIWLRRRGRATEGVTP